MSGKSFRAFCDERIFKPLGMNGTHFHDDHTEIVANSADSYRPGPDGRLRRAVSNLTALGSSSLFTTVNDLAKWIENLHSPNPLVGGPTVIARLHERGRLNNGTTIAYAFGQGIGEYRGVRVVNHTGSWAGYRSILERFPDQRFAVAILANTTDVNAGTLARQIADLYLADRFVPAPDAVPAPAAQTQAGRGAGAPAAWQPAAEDLQASAGEFRSAELQTSYLFAVLGAQLVARHFRTGEYTLRPIERDRFQAPMFGEVRFMRGPDNTIVGFTASSGRVRNLKFDRVTR